MSTPNLSRRGRAALLTTAVFVALLGAPTTASAEPRASHAARGTAGSDGTERETAERPADADELLAACPIDGAATFEDSWGWPRSGGRSHEGVDMIAARGTAVIAVRDGEIQFKRNRLGGNSAWLTAANGDKFYYAHLDGFSGESRTVRSGDLIGFVGSTGNAGSPHLHFETLPNGRVENPFAHTLAACVPTPDELAAMQQAEANVLNDPAVWARFLPTR